MWRELALRTPSPAQERIIVSKLINMAYLPGGDSGIEFWEWPWSVSCAVWQTVGRALGRVSFLDLPVRQPNQNTTLPLVVSPVPLPRLLWKIGTA